MKRKWTTFEKIIIIGGLLFALMFVLAGILLYLGVRYDFIRLN